MLVKPHATKQGGCSRKCSKNVPFSLLVVWLSVGLEVVLGVLKEKDCGISNRRYRNRRREPKEISSGFVYSWKKPDRTGQGRVSVKRKGRRKEIALVVDKK